MKLISNSIQTLKLNNAELLCISPLDSENSLRDTFRLDGPVILEALQDVGAILFRGYDVANADEFNSFAKILTPNMLEYAGGTSPRLKVKNTVYKSTEYPAQYDIAMHNEMSYHDRWPDFIFFFCNVAPQSGGETPIVDSRKVLAALPDGLVQEFERRGVSYRRNMLASSGSFGSWQRVFETDDRQDVERFCRERGIEFSWGENGTLHTNERRAALASHPLTGERVWFNQAHMWHISNAPDEIELDDIDEDALPMNAMFGDGGYLPVAQLQQVRAAFKALSFSFRWQVGDILLLDNMLMGHGRRPFSGPREILVTMSSR